MWPPFDGSFSSILLSSFFSFRVSSQFFVEVVKFGEFFLAHPVEKETRGQRCGGQLSFVTHPPNLYRIVITLIFLLVEKNNTIICSRNIDSETHCAGDGSWLWRKYGWKVPITFLSRYFRFFVRFLCHFIIFVFPPFFYDFVSLHSLFLRVKTVDFETNYCVTEQ